MGLCLTGRKEDVADLVFLTNDSLNVEWIANNLLNDVFYYNEIRNMRGCTGFFDGTRVSVQGLGIGPVNAAMYAVEITNELDAKMLIKIDTCRSLQADIGLGDIILPQTAHTTSRINKHRFNGQTFSAVADFIWMDHVYTEALKKDKNVFAGPVVSIETRHELEIAKQFAERGALAIDMEMNQTFTAAQRFHIPCVGILTVTENLVTGEKMNEEEAQKSFQDIARFALDAVTKRVEG